MATWIAVLVALALAVLVYFYLDHCHYEAGDETSRALERAYHRAKLPEFWVAPDKVFYHKLILDNGRVREADNVLPRYFKYKERLLVPIRSQGKCASCWAFAIADMLADRVSLHTGGTVCENLSTQELVSCFKPDSYLCDKGGIPEFAYYYVVANGLSKENAYPYEQFWGGPITPCKSETSWLDYVAPDPLRHEHEPDKIFGQEGSNKSLCQSLVFAGPRRADRARLLADNIRNIKTEIFLHGPVVGTVMVYDDLYRYDGERIYTKSPNARFRGGHAIEIFGWCDKGQNTEEEGFQDAYWICRNSWGVIWPRRLAAHPGYFYVRMGTNEVKIEERASACAPMLTRDMKSLSPGRWTDNAYTSYTEYVQDPERQQFFAHLQRRRKEERVH